MKSSCIKVSALLSLFLGTTILVSAPVHADSNVITNVHGDEIIIYADDTFKPALRDLGKTDNTNTTKNTAAKKSSRKISPLFNIAPSYEVETSPVYSTGDSVMPKLGDGLREADDAALNDLPPLTNEDELQTERDDLWQRIKNGYAMPDSTSPLVKKHEEWYSSRPDYVIRMVERSQRYLFHVVEEVEKRGMPTEIALLPMIESAYNPQAYSSSRASGIWQFVPSTGKYFGLKQNWWFDNRRNIIFATDAALSYLEKLYAMFGAWDLALAAYNAGEGTVARAVLRNQKAGLPTDYESLSLPPETRNYVPKLQAVKNIMTHPENYGLNIQTIANTPYFAKVSAPAKIDARLAAKLAGISDEEFLALNPSYNRPVITSEDKNLELLLPILSAQTFRTNLENYNKPLVSWKTYFAKKGERLEKIASKFGIHVSKLRDVNDLPAHNKIRKTSTILVPNGNHVDFKPDNNATARTETTMTDKLTGLTGNENEGKSTNIELASNEDGFLNIKTNDENEPIKNRSVTHKVTKGEVMASIAKRYGVSVKQIMTVNSLKTPRLRIGQLLTIDSSGNNPGTSKTVSTNKPQTYIVKSGDTLYSIAEKFDIQVDDLKRWNKKFSNHIQPGNKLTIKQSDSV